MRLKGGNKNNHNALNIIENHFSLTIHNLEMVCANLLFYIIQ